MDDLTPWIEMEVQQGQPAARQEPGSLSLKGVTSTNFPDIAFSRIIAGWMKIYRQQQIIEENMIKWREG